MQIRYYIWRNKRVRAEVCMKQNCGTILEINVWKSLGIPAGSRQGEWSYHVYLSE